MKGTRHSAREVKVRKMGRFPRTALGSRESGVLKGSHAYETRTDACIFARQRWTNSGTVCTGLPGFPGLGGGGWMEAAGRVKKAKGWNEKARSNLTHHSKRGAGRKETAAPGVVNNSRASCGPQQSR